MYERKVRPNCMHPSPAARSPISRSSCLVRAGRDRHCADTALLADHRDETIQLAGPLRCTHLRTLPVAAGTRAAPTFSQSGRRPSLVRNAARAHGADYSGCRLVFDAQPARWGNQGKKSEEKQAARTKVVPKRGVHGGNDSKGLEIPPTISFPEFPGLRKRLPHVASSDLCCLDRRFHLSFTE